ncbi:MAG: hypothetical protein DRH24_12865 [Deltaproteobacteria bacterium]|nr:MAG: hypothetical protein DRH24_12865 [Deltaproteobacteria bacterium]
MAVAAATRAKKDILPGRKTTNRHMAKPIPVNRFFQENTAMNAPAWDGIFMAKRPVTKGKPVSPAIIKTDKPIQQMKNTRHHLGRNFLKTSAPIIANAGKAGVR